MKEKDLFFKAFSAVQSQQNHGMICSIAIPPQLHFGQVTISQDRLQEFIRAELSYFASRHTKAMGKRE